VDLTRLLFLAGNVTRKLSGPINPLLRRIAGPNHQHDPIGVICLSGRRARRLLRVRPECREHRAKLVNR